MSRYLVLRSVFAVLVVAFVPSAVAAPATSAADSLVQPTISQEEVRRIIVAEQKTGYRRLPPGIVKNLVRGKPLPRGLQKDKVPAAIVEQLPAYPDYEWRRYGADLVLVQLATQLIAEIFSDAFR
jgi:hypothetical protein